MWYHGSAKIPFTFGEGMTYTTFKTEVSRSCRINNRTSYEVHV